MPKKPFGRQEQSRQPRTAFQRLQDQLKYVDLVVEVCDGRGPYSSRHPRSVEIFGTKPRLLILTKEDLSDVPLLRKWVHFFNEEGRQAQALSLSLKEQKHKSKIFQLILDLTKDKREQIAAKGLLPRPMRICAVGMPNTGKSSLINWLIGQKRAKTGNKPGVTKGSQWVRVHPDIELLDTPGILPAFQYSNETARILALLNLMPENIYDFVEVAEKSLLQMRSQYPKLITEYFGEPIESATLEDLARIRNFLTTGGRGDRIRAANVFISDLRSGKIGRVTMDRFDQLEKSDSN